MKTHRTDRVSLTFALIFLAIAGCWLAAAFVELPRPRVGWLLAGGLILIGLLGVLGALRAGRTTPTSSVEPGSGPPAPQPSTVEPVTGPPVPQPPVWERASSDPAFGQPITSEPTGPESAGQGRDGRE